MIIILIGALNTLIEGIKEENDKVIGKYLSIKHCALTVAKLTPIPFVVIITPSSSLWILLRLLSGSFNKWYSLVYVLVINGSH